MPNAKDVILGGIALAGEGIKRIKPKVNGSIPSVADLKQRVTYLYPSTAPETIKPTYIPQEVPETIPAMPQSISGGTSCIPCASDHLSTCSGVLTEALRFARTDGMESEEVVSRVQLCRDELNAMERVDLRPELTIELEEWEKEIANNLLNESRTLRHDLADMTSVEQLEQAAGKTQTTRTGVGRKWVQGRLANMTDEERAQVKQRAQELIDKQMEGGE